MIAGYCDSGEKFIETEGNAILGEVINNCSNYSVVKTQREAWRKEVDILKNALRGLQPLPDLVALEYKILGMTKWADAVLIVGGIIFVLEFKIRSGRRNESYPFGQNDIDQVVDYSQDLSDFNSGSHECPIVPVLIDTRATSQKNSRPALMHDNVFGVQLCANSDELREVIADCAKNIPQDHRLKSVGEWQKSTYSPTPTILDVIENTWDANDDPDMLRSGVGDEGVQKAVEVLNQVVADAKENQRKVVCFVTGVPGAGKTLVGLKLVGKRLFANDERTFITGNQPLMHVLREKWKRAAKRAIKQQVRKCKNQEGISAAWEEALVRIGIGKHEPGEAFRLVDSKLNERSLDSQALAMIKSVKTFKEESENGEGVPPQAHVVAFDEAQRAWVSEDDGSDDVEQSEPYRLLSYMDRVDNLGEGDKWCVLVALIGVGQHIHKKENGMSSWYKALENAFKDWHIISADKEEAEDMKVLKEVSGTRFEGNDVLFLDKPERSYRAKETYRFIKALLKGKDGVAEAKKLLAEMSSKENGHVKYHIRISRSLDKAREYAKRLTIGKRRCGMLASSKGKRLRRFGVYVPQDDFKEVQWFLSENSSVESSTALEVAGSEFKVQGLEVDVGLVAWDGDLHYDAKKGVFEKRSFSSSRNEWKIIEDQAGIDSQHLENAYRVLLTRAREAMVIYVPHIPDGTLISGCKEEDYSTTYKFLHDEIGIVDIEDP